MGLAGSTLDAQLVAKFKNVIPLTQLVKLGSIEAGVFATATPYFNQLINIERSGTEWWVVTKRFESESNVESHTDSPSQELSALLLNSPDTSTLYWLNAYKCNLASESNSGMCTLLEEVKSIGNLNDQSVILIDNARLFMLPSQNLQQWISFDEILMSLRALSVQHRIIIVNDILIFYPPVLHAVIVEYASFHGGVQLKAMQTFKEGVLLRKLLDRKEQSLRMHSNIVKAASLPILGHALRVIGRIYEIFAPRLGDLNQYQPRILSPSLDLKAKASLVNHPKISIVTPSYNQGGYIEKTLRSVLDQDYPNLEYFVQDGGSTDDTIEVLRHYDDKLSGWVSERDTGQSQAINRGFSRTTGEIMGWLNSDDLFLPNTLNFIADYFNQHPEVDVVYGNRLLINQNGMEIGRWILPGHDGNILSWADFIPQETLFWRRRIWDKVGSEIDESFRFAMDWDLIVRFRGVGAKFAHIPSFLGAFRIHESQKTSAAINEVGYQEMDRIRLRELGRVPTKAELRKALLPFIAKHIIVDLTYRLKRTFNKIFY